MDFDLQQELEFFGTPLDWIFQDWRNGNFETLDIVKQGHKKKEIFDKLATKQGCNVKNHILTCNGVSWLYYELTDPRIKYKKFKEVPGMELSYQECLKLIADFLNEHDEPKLWVIFVGLVDSLHSQAALITMRGNDLQITISDSVNGAEKPIDVITRTIKKLKIDTIKFAGIWGQKYDSIMIEDSSCFMYAHRAIVSSLVSSKIDPPAIYLIIDKWQYFDRIENDFW